MVGYFQEKWSLTVAETTFEITEKPNSGIWDHEIETLELATEKLDEKIKDIYMYVRNNLYINDRNKYIYNKLKFHTYLRRQREITLSYQKISIMIKSFKIFFVICPMKNIPYLLTML